MAPIFSVEAFKNPDGSLDDDKRIVKLRRASIHPGVFVKFLEEADITLTDYNRGAMCHTWLITAAGVEVFKAHLGKFTRETLDAHLQELRLLFPKTAAPPKPSPDTIFDSSILPGLPKNDIPKGDDEDEDEDEPKEEEEEE